MEENSELILMARDGSSIAFSRLARQYKPLINSLSQKYSSMCREYGEVGDDFLQEAQMAFFDAVKSYDINNSVVTFGAYAKACIRNRLVSLVRKFKSQKRKRGELKIQAGVMSPDDAYLTKELGTKLLALAENSLSPYEKNVFALYIEGKRASEISKNVGKSEKSVNNAIFRIRSKLKGIIG